MGRPGTGMPLSFPASQLLFLRYWAVRDLCMSKAELTGRLKLSLSGVSLSVEGGERIAQENDYKLFSTK